MRTHRYCKRCGKEVSKVTDKELRWNMRNILNDDRNAYKFDCKECDEFLFSFETIGLHNKKKEK